jgi:Na+-transporting methylmalonyl-CoA/oxaloacetate decarboxylase gamma subunit
MGHLYSLSYASTIFLLLQILAFAKTINSINQFNRSTKPKTIRPPTTMPTNEEIAAARARGSEADA